jgi:hypothetical protein
MVRRGVVGAVAAAVAAALLAFGHHGYPAPGTDAPSFLVSAINFAAGRGLVNPFYPQIAFGDPTGRNRHVYYPPAFPLVLAALMPEATPRGAFLAVGALRAASAGLAAWALCLLAVRLRAPASAGLTLLSVLALLGMATHWLPTLGRPEALGTLLVLLAALAALTLEGRPLLVALGAVLGVTAATQPMGALQLALVAVLYFAATRPPRRALAAAAVTGALAAAVFAAVLALSPHGLGETLAGMARSYPHTPWGAPPGSSWWRPWIFARRSTFYGLLVLAAVAGGAHLLGRRRADVRAPWLFAVAGTLLAACVYHGSLTHKSLRHYNALMLAPLLYGVVVAWAATAGLRAPRLARLAATACVAATAAGFLGHLAFFPWFLRHGRSLDAARAEWSRAPVPPAAPVSLIGNLWVLTEDYPRLQVTPVTALGDPSRLRPVLLLGQRPEHGGRAPEVAGYALARDVFNPALAAPGLHRYFVAEDYSFAAYAARAAAPAR